MSLTIVNLAFASVLLLYSMLQAEMQSLQLSPNTTTVLNEQFEISTRKAHFISKQEYKIDESLGKKSISRGQVSWS